MESGGARPENSLTPWFAERSSVERCSASGVKTIVETRAGGSTTNGFSMMRRLDWWFLSAVWPLPTVIESPESVRDIASDCFAAQLAVRSSVLHTSTKEYRTISRVTASLFTAEIISKSRIYYRDSRTCISLRSPYRTGYTIETVLLDEEA